MEIERRKDGSKELVPLEEAAKWVKDAVEKEKDTAGSNRAARSRSDAGAVA